MKQREIELNEKPRYTLTKTEIDSKQREEYIQKIICETRINNNFTLVNEGLINSGIFHSEIDLLTELINIKSDKILAVLKKLG